MWTREEEDTKGTTNLIQESTEVTYHNHIENPEISYIQISNDDRYSLLGMLLLIKTGSEKIHEHYLNNYHKRQKEEYNVAEDHPDSVKIFELISDTDLLINFIQFLTKIKAIPENISQQLQKDVLRLAKQAPKLVFINEKLKLAEQGFDGKAISEKVKGKRLDNDIWLSFMMSEYLYHLYKENKVNSSIVIDFYNSVNTIEFDGRKHYLDMLGKRSKKRISEIVKYERKKKLIPAYTNGAVIGLFANKNPRLPLETCTEISKYLEGADGRNVALTTSSSSKSANLQLINAKNDFEENRIKIVFS